jgi:transposase-like protein
MNVKNLSCPHCNTPITDRQLIEAALKMSDNVRDAAQLLGVSPATLYRHAIATGMTEKRPRTIPRPRITEAEAAIHRKRIFEGSHSTVLTTGSAKGMAALKEALG